MLQEKYDELLKEIEDDQTVTCKKIVDLVNNKKDYQRAKELSFKYLEIDSTHFCPYDKLDIIYKNQNKIVSFP